MGENVRKNRKRNRGRGIVMDGKLLGIFSCRKGMKSENEDAREGER